MSKYRFKCRECNTILTKRCSSRVKETSCECSGIMDRMIPRLNGAVESLETVDKESGTKWRADHNEDLKARSDLYFWKHHVPRLVDSGVYSLETLLQNGWVIVNAKGQIEVQTTPPNKR